MKPIPTLWCRLYRLCWREKYQTVPYLLSCLKAIAVVRLFSQFFFLFELILFLVIFFCTSWSKFVRAPQNVHSGTLTYPDPSVDLPHESSKIFFSSRNYFCYSCVSDCHKNITKTNAGDILVTQEGLKNITSICQWGLFETQDQPDGCGWSNQIKVIVSG